jgi:hypothetical protein
MRENKVKGYTISTTGVYQVCPVQKKNKPERARDKKLKLGQCRRLTTPTLREVKRKFFIESICEQINTN